MKSIDNGIPDIVIGRLPLYLRALSRLKQEGKEVTSSHELGAWLGISSAQIRKDLSHFGGFGKQGTGYTIDFLIEKLRRVLQIEHEWHVALVGAGNLGQAIMYYRGFADRGFKVSWVFDADEGLIGRSFGDLRVLSMDDFEGTIEGNGIQIAMLAVPSPYAQDVAQRMVQAGIRAILNYAPINISVPDGVMVQYIDPVIHLQHMTYYLERSGQE